MAKAKTSITTENRSGSAADAAAKEQRTETVSYTHLACALQLCGVRHPREDAGGKIFLCLKPEAAGGHPDPAFL